MVMTKGGNTGNSKNPDMPNHPDMPQMPDMPSDFAPMKKMMGGGKTTGAKSGK